MLNIQLEIHLATERRNDQIREAEQFRLAKATRTEEEPLAGYSLAFASRSYVILLQAITRFLPSNTNLRQRPAAVINPR